MPPPFQGIKNNFSTGINNQFGLVNILIAIILLVGIVIGVYLVQQKTNLFPKALENQPSLIWTVEGDFDPTNKPIIVTKNSSSMSTQWMATNIVSFKNAIYVCFITPDLKNTVGKSSDNGQTWGYTQISQISTDDPHNFCSLGVDSDGYIHVTYDMHETPLRYKKSANPEDISVFNTIDRMTSTSENLVTYPGFYKAPNNELYFTYRNGEAGQGNLYIKKYSTSSKTWSDFANPLIDGISGQELTKSPYWGNLTWDQEGNIHIAWNFRNDSTGNENIYYAKYNLAKNRWEKSDGTAYVLPIRPETAEIASKIIANGVRLAENNAIVTDLSNKPHIAFVKDSPIGKSEIFQTYFNGSTWNTTQMTSLSPEPGIFTDLYPPQMMMDKNGTIYAFFTDPNVPENFNFSGYFRDAIMPGKYYFIKSVNNGLNWSKPFESTLPFGRAANFDQAYFRESGKLRMILQDTTDNSGPLYILGDTVPEQFTNLPAISNIDKEQLKKGEIRMFNKLIGFWKFEEISGGVKDSTFYQNNGLTSALKGVPGKRGLAYEFNGSNSVRVDSPQFNLGKADDFTIQAWIKTTKPGGVIVSKQKSDGTGFSVELTNEGKLKALIVDEYGIPTAEYFDQSIIGKTILTDGNWHHVAAVFNRDSNLSIFVDGISDASPTSLSNVTGSISNSRVLVIGARDSNTEGDYFIGTIDEVAISTIALTPQEFNFNNDYLAPFVINSPDSGKYISFYQEMLPGIFKDLEVDAKLDNGTIQATVQTSKDKFVTVESEQKIDILNGKNRYPLSLTGSGLYVRVVIDLIGKRVNPTVSSFTVTKVKNIVSPPPSLLLTSYYKFDEGNGSVTNNFGVDSNLNGELKNMTTSFDSFSGWTELGKVSNGLNFDGLDDKADVSANPILDQNGDFSISAWIKTSSLTGQTIIAKNSNTTNNYMLYLGTIGNLGSPGKMSFRMYDSSLKNITGNILVADGNWHYVVGLKNGNNLSIYVDGKLDSDPTPFSTGVLTNTSNVTIGYRGGSSNDTFFKGTIDEIKIYKSALTSSQISEEFNKPGINPATALLPVVYFSFDEGQGNFAGNKGSGNSTIKATFANISANNVYSGWTDLGKFGKALKFDGVNDFICVQDATQSCRGDIFRFGKNKDFSITAWVKTTSKKRQFIVSKGWSNPQYHLRIDAEGNFDAQAHDGNNGVGIKSTKIVNDGNWHHVAAVYNRKSDLSIYVDGIYEGSDSDLAKVSYLNSSYPFLIGVVSDDGKKLYDQFQGQIDDVRVYEGILNQSQINSIIQQGNP